MSEWDWLKQLRRELLLIVNSLPNLSTSADRCGLEDGRLIQALTQRSVIMSDGCGVAEAMAGGKMNPGSPS